MMRCKIDCVGSESCEFECSLEFNECQDSCPCYFDCDAGCHDCEHSTCTCAYPEENADFIKCAAEGDAVYFACINECPVNQMACVSACGREYEDLMAQCPCQERG